MLLQLYCSHDNPIITSELDQVHAFVCEMGDDVDVQWGISIDDNLGAKVRVTVIATGYEVSDIPGLDDAVGKKTIEQAIDSYYNDTVKAPADTKESVAPPVVEVQQDEMVINFEEDGPVEISLEVMPEPQVAASSSSANERPASANTGLSGLAGWMRGRK